MTLPKINKNMLLIIGLVVVLIAGYFLFMSGSDTPEPLITAESSSSSGIGQELVVELNRLKALQNIKDDIFEDPVFLSLEDFTQAVVPQPLGRSNPFAPIGSSN